MARPTCLASDKEQPILFLELRIGLAALTTDHVRLCVLLDFLIDELRLDLTAEHNLTCRDLDLSSEGLREEFEHVIGFSTKRLSDLIEIRRHRPVSLKVPLDLRDLEALRTFDRIRNLALTALEELGIVEFHQVAEQAAV